MYQKIKEKMSHEFKNSTFKAILTLKKIRYISTKGRVLTPVYGDTFHTFGDNRNPF